MTAIYNEIEAYPAAWLRRLIVSGYIAQGTVIQSDIREVTPTAVDRATQLHTFAGIGVWSYALRLANWPNGLPVWTGSCPCQPFSTAGKRKGTDDERHLWPEWFRLIRECRPPIVFGEQVASPDGRTWLSTVRSDLEDMGYAVGAADLCAAGTGAPHIRQRIFFGAVRLAEPDGDNRGQIRAHAGGCHQGSRAQGVEQRSLHRSARDVVESYAGRRGETGATEDGGSMGAGRTCAVYAPEAADTSATCGMANAHDGQCEREPARQGSLFDRSPPRRPEGDGELERGGEGSDTRGFWNIADWLPCRDGKHRPVEPGTFPLAHGAPARVGRLRAYGNAIVPQVAATFVMSFMGALIQTYLTSHNTRE